MNMLQRYPNALFNTLLGACGALCAFFVYYPLTDPDIFWHLAAGREMVAQRSFLYVDPFSYTLENARWIDLHWLFQLFTYAVHVCAGTGGLLIAKSILFASAAILAILAIPVQKRNVIITAVAAMLLYESRYLVSVRPVLFTLLFMSIFIFAFERFIQHRRITALLMLIPIQILWINSQGLFMLGPAIAAAYASGEMFDFLAKRRAIETPLQKKHFWLLGGCVAAVCLVCVINPYGIDALSFPLKLFGRIDPSLRNIYSVNIVENTPLFGLLSTGRDRFVYAVIIATAITAVSFLHAGRSVRAAHVLIVLEFAVLAYMAQRNIVLYFFVLIPVLGWNMAGVAQRGIFARKSRSGKAAKIALGSVLFISIAFMASSHARVLANCPSGSDLAPFSHPIASVNYVQEHDIPGRLFNADRHGGYLIWRAFPGHQVFIDTRLIIRSQRFFAEYLAILDDPHRWFDQVRDRFGITQVVLPVALVDRYYPLARKLLHDTHWRLVYTDGAEALFVVDSLAPTPLLDINSPVTADSVFGFLASRWKADPAIRVEAHLHFGNFLMAMGCHESADLVLGKIDTPQARISRALLLASSGQSDSAIAVLTKLLEVMPRNVDARLALSSVYRTRKDYRSALENVILVVRREPFNKKAQALIRDIEKQLQP